ncbi:hypothetical protein LTR37_021047 [Vermiconidia calcicola]|uniref:Uncharacterized protein n=1 Tax=Vermiconidia calcicola TaxID=1690605 RepID=A0ACC3M9I3_9PEZI|nr:hypothetical protein LTR37_021047 [Vermiconidia calcicola]
MESDLRPGWPSTKRYGIWFQRCAGLPNAFAPDPEKRAPTSCPSPQYTAINGLEFKTYCGQVYDIDTRTITALSETPTTEESVTDCMNECANTQGRCYGVWFNTTDSACYQLDKSAYNGTRVTSSDTHVAVSHYSQWRAPQNTSCPFDDGSRYTTKNGEPFDIDGRFNAANYTSVHQSDISGCMDHCSADLSQNCAGVLFNFDLEDGFENCYLLNWIGDENKPFNYTFAELSRRTSGSTSSDVADSGSGSGSSKAWIAGPVVGGIVLMALLAALFFWLGRRSRQKKPQEQTSDEKRGANGDSWQSEEPQLAASQSIHEAGAVEHDERHMLPANERRPELRDPKTEALLQRQHELES